MIVFNHKRAQPHLVTIDYRNVTLRYEPGDFPPVKEPDARSRLIGPNESRNFDLPIVDGMGTADAIDPVRAQLVGRFMGALATRPELRRSVSQVDVSRVGNVTVLLDGDSTLLYLGDDQFVDRLRTYLEIRPTLVERMNDVDYVDLRYGQRVIVKDRNARTQRQ